MAAPKIRFIGDAILSRPSSLIDPLLPEVMSARKELHAALAWFRAQHGFGRAISAPQIGRPMRMIALNLGSGRPPFTMHNPQLLEMNGSLTMWDDCMSFPDFLVRVQRFSSCSVTYLDEAGHRVHLPSSSVPPALAELLQHEVDHLDGITAFDRMMPAAPGTPSVVHRSVYEANRASFDGMVEYSITPTVGGGKGDMGTTHTPTQGRGRQGAGTPMQ